MKKKFLSLAFLLISFWANSQLSGMVSSSVTLPSFSLLDIEPNNSTLVLQLNAPTEAGLMNTTQTVSGQKWLNYTSAQPASSTRSITVQRTSGASIPGLQFYIGADAATGGFGELGSAVGYVLINNTTAKTLISNIGSTYTGNGINMGHSLNYKITVSSMSLLDVDNSATIGLTFTIIDN